MRVLVVGCGIVGLTSAHVLLEAGHQVRVIGKDFPLETTSAVAAALWFPYLAEPRDKVLAWSRRTLARYREQAVDARTGIRWVQHREFFEEQEPKPWWLEAVDDGGRLSGSVLPHGYRDGWCAMVPVVESTLYLKWLEAGLAAQGCRLERRTLTSLEELEGEADTVLNCTGLGSRELLGDAELYPIRGQIVRVAHQAGAYSAAADEGPLGISYLIPRSEDAILGGTAEKGNGSMVVDPDTAAKILARAAVLAPELEAARVLEHRVGLRPGRSTVRLGWDEGRFRFPVLHNYGHGGSGYTIAWGCAESCLELLDQKP